MKAMNLCALLSVMVLFLVGSASAWPGLPNQFYGSVTVDGSSAPDGVRVSAHIGGDVYATTTSDGAYNLMVKDPENDRDGETIEFFVNYVKVSETTLENEEADNDLLVRELNLVFTKSCGDGVCTSGETCSSCSQDCGSCQTGSPGSTGSSSSSSSYIPPCYENWTCGDWSECGEDEVQARSCEDRNGCGTELERPSEERSCTYTPPAPQTICSAGSKVCSGGDTLIECSEGKQWNIIKNCEYGCDSDTLDCKQAPAASGVSGAAGGITGLFSVGNTPVIYGMIIIVIVIFGLLVYWTKFK